MSRSEVRAKELEIWGRIEDMVKAMDEGDFFPHEAYIDETEIKRYKIALMNVTDRLEKLAGGDPDVGERASRERSRVNELRKAQGKE